MQAHEKKHYKPQETKKDKEIKNKIHKKVIVKAVKDSKEDNDLIKALRVFISHPNIKALPEDYEIPFSDFIEFVSQKEIVEKYPQAVKLFNSEDFQIKSYAHFFNLWRGKVVVRPFLGSPNLQRHILTFCDIPTLVNVNRVDRKRNQDTCEHLDTQIKALLKYRENCNRHMGGEFRNYAHRAKAIFHYLYGSLSSSWKCFYTMLHIGNTAAVKKMLNSFFMSDHINGTTVMLNGFERYAGHPLTIAAEQGYIDIVDFLLKEKLKKLNFNSDDFYRQRLELPLEAAARSGRKRIVEKLLEEKHKSVIKIKGTELGLAAKGGFHDIVKQLIATKHPFQIGVDALVKVASDGNEQILQDILFYDQDGSKNNPGVVISAARHGRVEIVRLLHESKVDITQANLSYDRRETAIAHAVAVVQTETDAKAAQTETVHYLLENKADANETLHYWDTGHWPLLHIASGVSCIDFLGRSGYQPYSLPVDRIARPDVISLLLEHKANINALAPDGSTALHTAARSGSTAAVKILLAKGANTGIKTKEGCAPVDVAANDDVRRVMIQHEASVIEAQVKAEKEKASKAAESKEEVPVIPSKTPAALFCHPSPFPWDEVQSLAACLSVSTMTDPQKETLRVLSRIIQTSLQMGPEPNPAGPAAR